MIRHTFARLICRMLLATPMVLCALASAQTVKLDSFTVASSNPANVAKWKQTKVQINATMLLPSTERDKYPAILYLLGSGGFSSDDQTWIDLFLKNGYAVLWVDQYTARGLTLARGLGANQDGVSDMSFLHDAASGLRYLKMHPKIDAERIASFGRSWGGVVPVYMADTWYMQNALNGEVPKLRLALYPPCYFTPKNPKPSPGKTFFFLGEKDDWNEPMSCTNYAERVAKAGGNINVKIYPDAVHSFDTDRPRSEVSVVVWGRCESVWDTDSLMAQNVREGIEHNLKDGTFGKLFDKCVRKATVKMAGTPALRSVVEASVMQTLSDEL